MSQLQYWVWLSMRFGVRPKVKLALVEHFGTPRDVYFATEADYRVRVPLRPEELRQLQDKDLKDVNRVFMPDVKSTAYLPFSIDEASADVLGKFYEFDEYESETGIVYFKQVNSTEAGKAYIFKPNTDKLVAEGDLDVCVTEHNGGTADGMYGTWERKVWTEALVP